MSEGEKTKLEVCTDEIIRGFYKLPVLARLQFVSDVLCERAGSQGEEHYDPTLGVLVEIIDKAVRVLETVPGIERLCFRKPAPP